jgi:hypothetical protein
VDAKLFQKISARTLVHNLAIDCAGAAGVSARINATDSACDDVKVSRNRRIESKAVTTLSKSSPRRRGPITPGFGYDRKRKKEN